MDSPVLRSSFALVVLYFLQFTSSFLISRHYPKSNRGSTVISIVCRHQLQPYLHLRATTWVLEENCNTETIHEAAEFLMDHFWLETPMHWTDETDTEITEPKDRPNLLKEQMDDLMRNYGERMGKKALKSGLIWIRSDEGQALGLVCLMQLLLRKENGGLISHIDSNEMIQSAVASLGPKQRRVFQKASAEEVVTQLLPQYDLICMVSNLSVAFRRKGLGKQLCQHAETIAKETWGHDRLHLKVETTNTAAMALYEQVGYSAELSISSDPAVRIDKRNGAFTVQESVSTILMSKDL